MWGVRAWCGSVFTGGVWARDRKSSTQNCSSFVQVDGLVDGWDNLNPLLGTSFTILYLPPSFFPPPLPSFSLPSLPSPPSAPATHPPPPSTRPRQQRAHDPHLLSSATEVHRGAELWCVLNFSCTVSLSHRTLQLHLCCTTLHSMVSLSPLLLLLLCCCDRFSQQYSCSESHTYSPPPFQYSREHIAYTSVYCFVVV